MKVALIGTGLMGTPMAQRLLSANKPVIVYNRSLEKAEPLKAAGAEVAASPEEAVQKSDCVITMLTNAEAIRETLLSNGSQKHLSGRTVIQMSTISPTESQALSQDVAAVNGEYLEAPVLGSISEAKSGKLIVMVGAEPEQFQRCSDLLKCFGPEPHLIGPVGQAASLKLALNQLIAALTAAFSLSLGLIQRQGVDVEKFMEIVRHSALYAPTFDKKLPRMLNRDYADPNFPTQHLLKDVNLFLTEANSAGLETSQLAGIKHLLEGAIAQGLAAADYSSLFEAVNPKES